MQNNLKEQIPDTDINDVFEDILFSEEKVIAEGYEKGFAIGSTEENIEGYHLGYHRGAEIGSELGYYQAFVEHYLNDEQKSMLVDKVLKNLEILKQDIHEFPRSNVEGIDLFESIEKIRALYKKVCTQLKIKFDYKNEGINF